MEKCRYARCGSNAELILVIGDRRVYLCRKHYERILRYAERVISDTLYLETILKLKCRRVHIRAFKH
ncbi:MAG: hypothetical protein DRK00_10010 [Thermoprotei archaeon]|nr:MAG: hypothetical protein DRK00_10010 [Thermoprotei archaeon]